MTILCVEKQSACFGQRKRLASRSLQIKEKCCECLTFHETALPTVTHQWKQVSRRLVPLSLHPS